MTECIEDKIKTDSLVSKSQAPKGNVKSLEISITGLDSLMLDAFSTFIRGSSQALGAHCPPPSTMPVHFDRWTVLASPHVHKTARTQFERRTHTRILRVSDLHPDLVPKLIWYVRQHSPPDVKTDCKIFSYHSMPL